MAAIEPSAVPYILAASFGSGRSVTLTISPHAGRPRSGGAIPNVLTSDPAEELCDRLSELRVAHRGEVVADHDDELRTGDEVDELLWLAHQDVGVTDDHERRDANRADVPRRLPDVRAHDGGERFAIGSGRLGELPSPTPARSGSRWKRHQAP